MRLNFQMKCRECMCLLPTTLIQLDAILNSRIRVALLQCSAQAYWASLEVSALSAVAVAASDVALAGPSGLGSRDSPTASAGQRGVACHLHGGVAVVDRSVRARMLNVKPSARCPVSRAMGPLLNFDFWTRMSHTTEQGYYSTCL